MKFLFWLIVTIAMIFGVVIYLICQWLANNYGAGPFIAIAIGIYIMFKFKDLKNWYKTKWQKKKT